MEAHLMPASVQDINSYSPLVLAYIGDAVFDVMIRTMVVSKGNAQVSKLHKETTKIVRAAAQKQLAEAIRQDLTEEEMAVYRRGRNAKSATTAKNATISEYRHATGFEALIGYLYLSGRHDRLEELVNLGLSKTGEA